MGFFLLLAAVVVFAITAILAFWATTITLATIVGLVAVGLALVAAAMLIGAAVPQQLHR